MQWQSPGKVSYPLKGNATFNQITRWEVGRVGSFGYAVGVSGSTRPTLAQEFRRAMRELPALFDNQYIIVTFNSSYEKPLV